MWSAVLSRSLRPVRLDFYLDSTLCHHGAPLSVRIAPRIQMNTNDAVLELVSRGWGISRLLSYQVAERIAQGAVQAILDGFEPPPMPIHVVHQEGRMVSSKVRAFVDFMVDRLRARSGGY